MVGGVPRAVQVHRKWWVWFGKFAMMEWFEWPGIGDIRAIDVRARAHGWMGCAGLFRV